MQLYFKRIGLIEYFTNLFILQLILVTIIYKYNIIKIKQYVNIKHK